MSDGTTQNAGGGASGGATQGTPWYTGLDSEHVGHVQSKGWDKLDPAAAAVELTKAHRQAQQFIGVPAEQLLRMPKDANDVDGAKAMWQRLGAPAEPSGYEFEGVNAGDVTGSLVDTLREAAAGANLPKAAAAQVAKSVADWVNKQAEGYTSGIEENRAAAEAAIKKSWGANYAEFEFVANQGRAALAARLGERLAPQLENVFNLLRDQGLGEIGREIERVIGHGLREDKFAGGAGAPAPGGMNTDMAAARKSELMRDTAWAGRYIAGGAAERSEMAKLNAILVGE